MLSRVTERFLFSRHDPANAKNAHLPLAGGDLRRVFNSLREAPPSS